MIRSLKSFGIIAVIVLCIQLNSISVTQAQSVKLGHDIQIEDSRGAIVAAGASIKVVGNLRPGISPLRGAYLGGGAIDINANIDGPVIATGSNITVKGQAEALIVIGASVIIDQSAIILSDLTAAGSAVSVDGTIQGDAHLSGHRVEFDGYVEGDLKIDAVEIILGPKTVVVGSFTYSGDAEPLIADDADVKSAVQVERVKKKSARNFDRQIKQRAFGTFFGFVSLSASGVLLISLFPGLFSRVRRAGKFHPISTSLIGFAGVVILPILAILLMLIGIGLPVGGFLLMSYIGLLILSIIGASVSIGAMLFDRDERGAELLPFLAATAILLLLMALPVIGGAVSVLAVALGFGAMVRGFWASLREG